MAGKIDARLAELGITLPDAQSPVANYVPSVRTGNLIYLSGLGPMKAADGTRPIGKLGQDFDTQQGYDAARLVGINMLARIRQAVDGDFDRVKQVVKLLSMVNSTGDFTEHPKVANGCSDLLVEVFGDVGRHARSAVGMGNLPGNIPIEIEAIIEVSD